MISCTKGSILIGIRVEIAVHCLTIQFPKLATMRISFNS